MHNSEPQSCYGYSGIKGSTTTHETGHDGNQFPGHLYGGRPCSGNSLGAGKGNDHVQQPKVGNDENITVSLSPDQYAQVQKMLHKSPTFVLSAHMAGNICTLVHGKNICDWIIDPGANNHMVCQPSVLSDITSYKGIGNVHLFDGSKLHILYVGSCRLRKGKIRNVLYIPGFKLNLLLVAKLTRKLNCDIKLYLDFCLLQDLHTGQVKGIGKMIDDLYHLKSRGKFQHSITAYNSSCNSSISNDI